MSLSKDYLLALKSLEGIGVKKILKVGNYIEDNSIDVISSTILATILESLKIKVKKEKVSAAQIDDALIVARRLISNNERAGIGITTYYDDDFPSSLRSAINEEGKLDPPIVLYYKGDLSITRIPCIAVIGTREISDFGANAGLYLSKEFAKRGFCIVSGLAIGCDTIGHKGALAVNGKTIAFMGHGLDSIYPPENDSLANEIVAKGGLLISEYPIGMTVNRYNLVARDRLQSGLSLATIVIQTGIEGGTMHAANTTLEANKPLYVVKYQKPEQNEHEKSLGNTFLAKKGAKYISGTDNIDEIADTIRNYQKPKTSLFD